MIFEIFPLKSMAQRVKAAAQVLTNPQAVAMVLHIDDDQVPSVIPLPQPMKSAEYPVEGMAA